MAIVIKDMALPKSCNLCPLKRKHSYFDGEKYRDTCFVIGATNETFIERRPLWCPLVEVEPVYQGANPDQELYCTKESLG